MAHWLALKNAIRNSRMSSFLQKGYRQIFGLEVKEKRESLNSLLKELGEQQKKVSDLQQKFNASQESLHNLSKTINALERNHEDFISYVNKEVQLFKEKEQLSLKEKKREWDKTKENTQKERQIFEQVTQRMNDYFSSEIAYRNFLQILSYIYAILGPVIGWHLWKQRNRVETQKFQTPITQLSSDVNTKLETILHGVENMQKYQMASSNPPSETIVVASTHNDDTLSQVYVYVISTYINALSHSNFPSCSFLSFVTLSPK
ncbi:hypothetical protein RFI_13889 [Reticulomyxa filosa]|uniref:Uncharacterized protein n=1 Tax=Reticulomyxa filosa TaxID=46433 RepID=X6NBB3_RETFI|nr:hypothetical protein RFI_13889 [Reticulomyxa filosa]|eukprot:ETO23296.1 hypothetical protein RFI_13889 [Reticulomyxa filosa]